MNLLRQCLLVRGLCKSDDNNNNPPTPYIFQLVILGQKYILKKKNIGRRRCVSDYLARLFTSQQHLHAHLFCVCTHHCLSPGPHWSIGQRNDWSEAQPRTHTETDTRMHNVNTTLPGFPFKRGCFAGFAGPECASCGSEMRLCCQEQLPVLAI